MDLKKDLEQLKFAAASAQKQGISLFEEIDQKKAMLDYALNQKKYIQKQLFAAIAKVKQDLTDISSQPIDMQDSSKVQVLMGLAPQLSLVTDYAQLSKIVSTIEQNLVATKAGERFVTDPKIIPADI